MIMRLYMDFIQIFHSGYRAYIGILFTYSLLRTSEPKAPNVKWMSVLKRLKVQADGSGSQVRLPGKMLQG